MTESDDYTTPFEKKPFERKHLDSSKDDILNVRFNEEERARLLKLKRLLQYDSDGRVLKDSMIVMENVVVGLFGEKMMGYISSQRRAKSAPQETEKL